MPRITKINEDPNGDRIIQLVPKIIGFYGHGMSFQDISNQIKDMFDVDNSLSNLGEKIDRVLPQVKAW